MKILGECQRCLFTSDMATISGRQCNYCDLHDEMEIQAAKESFTDIISRIVQAGRGKTYDCLIGISGGLDSSTMLYGAVRYWGLRPLVIHFDNGWNTPEAEHNMVELVKKLNIDCIRFLCNKKEYDDLNDAFLYAGTPDADIPNDIAMTKLMYQTAHEYHIKYILNGHDFRTEGSTPAAWTYMDARYIQDVYRKHTTARELQNFPLFTVEDQIFYGLCGIRQVRPFYYIANRLAIEKQMQHEIDWQDYGGKHKENIYTEFVGSHLLPEKFGIDKRRVYLSARIRAGEITKQDALIEMMRPVTFDMSKLGDRSEEIMLRAHLAAKRTYRDYKHYNFKRYKPLIWFMAKLGVVPYTFYKKYCIG